MTFALLRRWADPRLEAKLAQRLADFFVGKECRPVKLGSHWQLDLAGVWRARIDYTAGEIHIQYRYSSMLTPEEIQAFSLVMERVL